VGNSGEDYFARRRFPDMAAQAAHRYGEEYTGCVAAKETLDLYGVKIHWNQTKKYYEPEHAN
jgi:hypothetical protein